MKPNIIACVQPNIEIWWRNMSQSQVRSSGFLFLPALTHLTYIPLFRNVFSIIHIMQKNDNKDCFLLCGCRRPLRLKQTFRVLPKYCFRNSFKNNVRVKKEGANCKGVLQKR